MPRPDNGAFLISVVAMALSLPQSAGAQVAEREPQEIGFSGLATFDEIRESSDV